VHTGPGGQWGKKGKHVRSTIVEIARKAGVSSATVDRVLNDRAGVSDRTKTAVLRVARDLDYIADENIATFPASEPIRLNFILPSVSNAFIGALLGEIERQAALDPALDVQVRSMEGFGAKALAEVLYGLTGKTQGVGVVGLDHPAVSEAIRSLSASGIKVATLVSDIHHVPRVGYVGIDNRAAGRLAGFLLGRFLDGGKKHKAVLLAGSLSFRGHEEREMGFRHVISEDFGNIEIVETREVLEDRQMAYNEAKSLLDHHPDLGAIYNIGAGTGGIVRALKEAGREKSVVFIGHELTKANKLSLLDGTLDALIDQNPRVEAREALALLANAVRNVPFVAHPPRLQAIFRENIPAYSEVTGRTD
jgi:LacI family transcriptional regulator, galactose operon repressor